MASLAVAASSVGAGVSQVRFQARSQPARLKDQEQPIDDPRTAALQLIQRALAVTEATGIDLDVLA